MGKFFKILSTSLISLLLFNTISYATPLTSDKTTLTNNNFVNILDITKENSKTLDNYSLIITNEENLNKSLDLSDKLNKPIFIETSDYSIKKIASLFNINSNYKEDQISPQENLELKGYLVYKDAVEKIEPWFVEKNLAETTFKNDLENKIKTVESNSSMTSIQPKAAAWPVADSYAINLTYTEAYVGVSGILYNSGSSSPTGQQDMIVEVSPRSSTYYDYSCEYFTNELSFTNGRVLDYSPENQYSTTSISISYPWGISASFNLGGTLDVTKTNGGIGYNYSTWKFDPSVNSGFYNVKGKATAEFSSSSFPLKSSISTYITLRTTEKSTGSTSVRTVNYNTTFSS